MYGLSEKVAGKWAEFSQAGFLISNENFILIPWTCEVNVPLFCLKQSLARPSQGSAPDQLGSSLCFKQHEHSRKLQSLIGSFWTHGVISLLHGGVTQSSCRMPCPLCVRWFWEVESEMT